MEIADALVRQAAGTDEVVAELRAEMAALAARLDARMDGLSSQVRVLTEQQDRLDRALAGLDGRVTALEPEPEPEPAPAVVPWLNATWPVAGTDTAAITSGLGVRINQAGPGLTGGVPTLAVLGTGRLSIRKNGTYGHFVARWPAQPTAGECWAYSYEISNDSDQTDREEHLGCLCEMGAIHFVHTAMLPARGAMELVGGTWYHGLRRLYWSHLPGDVRVEARAPYVVAAGQTVVVQGVLEWTSGNTFRAYPRLLDKHTGNVLARTEDYVLTDQSGARLVDWYAQGRTLRRNALNPDLDSIRDFSVGAAQNDGSPSMGRYYVSNLRLAYVPNASVYL